jgi:gas vesicle protein
MSEPANSQPRVAGGIFVALGLLLGAIVGVAVDQPSAGMIIGMGIGAVIAVVVWLFDRKRSQEG